MKLKLFLDEDIHTGLSHALRQRGFDVVHAQDLKRKGRSDSEQLAFAVQEERCLMTFNVRDFVNLHNQYVGQNKGALGDHRFPTDAHRGDAKAIVEKGWPGNPGGFQEPD
jgi:hypothetical protein